MLTFQDVARRARTIQSVTQSRYMPPWKADPHYVSFANERRLTDQQIALIRRWTESGAKRGPEVARTASVPTPEKAPSVSPT
ncbi:hypothetical protein H9L05_11885 [Hymenobacter qilianensis]|uniref:Uncharacterized protein n=1 Tax=Hymenobacter qilianensis TaxID=1385715 RepID=A0A7H0GRF4_9BACT|nr:hypothetical protein [Hymenobacter qilianensis]QNP50870.1 hypothetical protein H9L05_11885 [Hymenobacter qilianensis]